MSSAIRLLASSTSPSTKSYLKSIRTTDNEHSSCLARKPGVDRTSPITLRGTWGRRPGGSINAMTDGTAAAVGTRRLDGEEVAATLGSALRRLRKAQGLTLQQLASRCGLSQPFLSQLENGKAMPSLMALHHVAQALETTAHSLLQPQERLDISLVRHGEGETYQLTEGGSVRFLTRGGSHLMEPNEVEFNPGAGTANVGHEGEEVIYVLEGRLRVALEGSRPVELNRGDVYAYPATIPHTMTAAGHAGCRFLVVTSPPSF